MIYILRNNCLSNMIYTLPHNHFKNLYWYHSSWTLQLTSVVSCHVSTGILTLNLDDDFQVFEFESPSCDHPNLYLPTPFLSY